MEMTSNCDVTNSAHQKQTTTIWPWIKPPMKIFCVRHWCHCTFLQCLSFSAVVQWRSLFFATLVTHMFLEWTDPEFSNLSIRFLATCVVLNFNVVVARQLLLGQKRHLNVHAQLSNRAHGFSFLRGLTAIALTCLFLQQLHVYVFVAAYPMVCNNIPIYGVNCYNRHQLTFYSVKGLRTWIFLVCLLSLSAKGCSKTSASFLLCSYFTLVVMLF